MAWALSISLIFVSMLVLLTLIYLHLAKSPEQSRNPDGSLLQYPKQDRHVALRIAILGLMASYGLATVGLMPYLLSSNGITDAGIVSVINSAVVAIGAVIYIFAAYVFVYLIYYMIRKIMENSQAKKRKRVEL